MALAAALCLPAVLPAQRYSFKLYGHEEGLNNLAVTCLLQSRRGFLWVGTQNGLFTYDGRRFLSLNRASGLPSSRIEALHESADGTLWVSTRSGLAWLDGTRFQQVQAGVPYEIVGPGGLASDGQGRIYASSSRGLLVGEAAPGGSQRRFRLMTTPEGPLGSSVFAVHADPAGVVWFGCGGHLCRLESGRITIVGAEHGVPEQRWDAIVTDARGRLWVRSSRRLLMRPKSGSGFVARDEGLPQSGESGALALDRNGRLFVPTDMGVAFREDRRWRRIGAAQGLITDATSCLLQDREGSMWIGLRGVGVARWLGYKEWESWTQAEGLSSDIVWAIRRDRAGGLWVGTNQGLNRLAPDQPAWKAWRQPQGLGGDRVRAVVVGPQDEIWVGSHPGGISRLDPRTGRIVRFGVESGLEDDRVFALLVDREKRLWASTRGGLFRSTPLGGAIRFERQQPPGTDPSEMFFQCLQDRAGRLWVAGSRGLVRWEDGAWTRFTTQDGIRHNYVSYLAEPPDGGLWIGYREALGLSRLRFGPRGLQVEHVTRNQGLRSEQAIFLGVDARGWVWYGSDNGVDVYDGSAWRHYGQSDGLIWDDCDGNAFFADADGSVWIGTSRGLSRFRPLQPPPPRVPPPVALTIVQLGDQRWDRSSPLSGPYTASFEAQTAALTFLNERAVRFRYRLLGLADAWTETDQARVRLDRLPPGEYTYEILARSAAGIWSAEAARVSFHIRPAWWQTWWCRLAVVVLAAAAVALWWRWRIRRLVAERQRLEMAVRARTQEVLLEKTVVEGQKQKIETLLVEAQQASRLKSEFLANVSHEIRTPMNGVMGMTALALGTELTPEQREYLEVVQLSAESLLALLDDVLDFSKIEAGRLEIEPVDFPLRRLITDAGRTLEGRVRQKGLLLESEVDPRVPDALVGDPVRLRQVLLNLIGNAIKFTGRGRILIRTQLESQSDSEVRLLFSVADSGIGIPKDKQGLIFDSFRQADGSTTRKYGGTGLGLAICQRLVEMMGGMIWVVSDDGRGSTFHFTARFGLGRADREPSPGLARLAAAAGEDPQKRCLRVLLAEDNPVNQMLAVRLLQKQGYSVTVAANGREALQQLEGGSFDLVLMDVQMPEMDGLEAAAAIRERERYTGRRIPILAMTAHAMKGDREKCLEAGMDGYLTKPVQAQQLWETIEALVAPAPAPVG